MKNRLYTNFSRPLLHAVIRRHRSIEILSEFYSGHIWDGKQKMDMKKQIIKLTRISDIIFAFQWNNASVEKRKIERKMEAKAN